MQEQKNDNEYFIIIRDSSGRYISKCYKSEKDFKEKRWDIEGLLISEGISKRCAEKICLDFNDSHFPIPGLEKFMI